MYNSITIFSMNYIQTRRTIQETNIRLVEDFYLHAIASGNVLDVAST